MDPEVLDRIARAAAYKSGLRWEELEDAVQHIWERKYLRYYPKSESIAYTMAKHGIIDFISHKKAQERIDRLGYEGYWLWRSQQIKEGHARRRLLHPPLTPEQKRQRDNEARQRRYHNDEEYRQHIRDKNNRAVRRWRERKKDKGD